MAIPDQQFQDIIEQIEQTVKDTIQETLKQVLPQIANTEPFDPLVFRHELLKDIEQKFQQFKEELALALDGNTPLPSFPNTEEIKTPKKSSWLDKKLF